MSRRILLADDSVTIQKVIELTFMDEDFEVSAVSNGDEAVGLLSRLQPEIVIADVHMPGANGYEVCRRSKALNPQIPVLLLVGTFEPFDEAQARAAGSDAFLKKPFDSQELLHIVQGLLAKSGSEPAPAAAAAPPPLTAIPPLAEAPAPAFAPPLHHEPEPAWSGFELEAEPEPQPAPRAAAPAADPWAVPDFGRAVGSSEEEQLFELEPADLSVDESLLARESAEPIGPAEPFEFPAVGGSFGGPAEPEPEEAPLPDLPDWAVAPAPFAAPAASAPPAPAVSAALAGLAASAASAVALPPPAAAVAPPPPSAAPASVPPTVGSVALSQGPLSDAEVDRIARRVVELLGDKVVRDVAWEVIPDLAEVVIKDRLRELESQAE